jgi:hypothetical protein
MILSSIALVLLAGVAFVAWQVHQRHLDRWLLAYLRQAARRRAPRKDEEVHVFLCFADHYEPKFQSAPPEVAQARVRKWLEEYPRQFARFRDSDGRTPRHTFFYPAEEYEPEYLEALASLCVAGFGEVEIHLHHDNDTADNLRATLDAFKQLLATRHGLLGRHRHTGEPGYAFIHGNWALCNSRPDGRYCGVNNELPILRETGCFVDMTMPSAPSPTQTGTINSIYYAVDRPGQPASHDKGVEAGSAEVSDEALLLIQGPLMLDWHRRKWGLLPRLENGCVQGSQPPTLERLLLWVKARVQVKKRPDWFFVKLHCHGAAEDAHGVLLGEPMVRFHEQLAEHARRNPKFHYHYVTAREAYNLARAAEAGWTGTVAEARDYEYLAPGSPSPVAADSLTPTACSQE